MSSNENRHRLINLGMFLAPVLLVKGAAVILGGETVSTGLAQPATVAPLPVIDIATPRLELSPEQQAAIDHIKSLRDLPFGEVPLYFEHEDSPQQITVPEDSSAPRLVVTAILGSSNGNTALIDGKSYREGDPIGDAGWLVTRIDSNDRSVTIQNPATGRESVLTVKINR